MLNLSEEQSSEEGNCGFKWKKPAVLINLQCLHLLLWQTSLFHSFKCLTHHVFFLLAVTLLLLVVETSPLVPPPNASVYLFM